ncbi:D-arabinono-1,4-lactone oxidase [Microbacterium sp. ET2]|uniref:D-arabinono-1,4-lactone oxidase n=1 Tax=Microbacterium albipurpureum TaxID=3050384 RepID=UPI00259CEC24|nr:D-arabinono-1,4-lactone oxidase [Microbacterium sp. ET2 (Ac-2212)]WJL96002.1 D-arabinono-1,4-lactone oxidase [Microbacterium sp. ET2 (Ac-2212)]
MTRPGAVWRNWGRTVQAKPVRAEFPATPEAVERAVGAAARRRLRIKPVGSGHSFSGIAVAPDVLLDLSALSGVVAIDSETMRVTLGAGTPLHQVPRLLARHGLAMQNLGDIDRQTIAGAIATGTHGTGLAFGGLATQVVGVTIVTGTGETRRIAEDDPLLAAVSLGLGALGVLVDVTLQCVPAFHLEAVERREPLDEVVAGLLDRARTADHFEFYWFPHTDVALTKTNRRLAETTPRRPLPRVGRFIDETVLANGVYRGMCAVGRALPPAVPAFSRLATRVTGDRTYLDRSHRVFTQRRGVRFREMEYALPAENVASAFAEVRALIAAEGWRISFPLEVRFAAGDDRWLSTAYDRPTGYIAVHRYFREDPTAYFTAVEQIMLAYDARPHWGKLHSLGADVLRDRYPRFDDFLSVRRALDPDGLFRNEYLDRVLGL